MRPDQFNILVVKFGLEKATKAFNWFADPSNRIMAKAVKGKDQADYCIKTRVLWDK